MRSYAKAFFVFSSLAIAGACADNTAVAPAPEAPAFVAPANFIKVGYVITFRVDNAKGSTQMIQDHVINFPANAICELGTSGYGTDYWNKSCKPMKGSVNVTATVLAGPDGAPYIDFQPAMRFSPNKEVTLFFKDARGASGNVTINYCNNLGYCVDESLDDPSLRPYRIGRNIIGRRVKHFSGYVIAYDECLPGQVCPPPPPSDGMMRRSGYMVASGEDIKDVMKDDRSDDKDSKEK